MGRNIAGAAGVTIVPPGAADVFALFDDEKRFHAGFEEFDAHANAGKAGADDEDVDIRGGRGCGRSGDFGHARAITSLFDSAEETRARRNAAPRGSPLLPALHFRATEHGEDITPLVHSVSPKN